MAKEVKALRKFTQSLLLHVIPALSGGTLKTKFAFCVYIFTPSLFVFKCSLFNVRLWMGLLYREVFSTHRASSGEQTRLLATLLTARDRTIMFVHCAEYTPRGGLFTDVPTGSKL